MYLKPLIKTTFIASLLFFVLVFLGMKYHWIEFFQNKSNNNTELVIPEQKPLPDVARNGVEEERVDEDFQPQLIQTQEPGSLIENMTKEQVELHCSELYQATEDKVLLELAVGNCVLNNFKDPYQDTNLEESDFKSSNNRQIQTQKKNMMIQCQQQVEQLTYSNEVERQLLLGVCVSSF